MGSNIILCEGESELCDTYYGSYLSVPKAFLTESFAGIRLEGKQGEFKIESTDTGRRSLLAAIRGAYLVQELMHARNKIKDSDTLGDGSAFESGSLDGLFIACINTVREEDINLNEITKYMSESRFKKVQEYVPDNFEEIISVLVVNNIPFDEDEILVEIKKGRIKKTSTIDDLLHKNSVFQDSIDVAEYGWESNLLEINTLLNEQIKYAALFRPAVDEYFANFNEHDFKAVGYGRVNLLGYAVYSKLKNDKNMNFDLIFNVIHNFEDSIKNLIKYPEFDALICFKASSKKNKIVIYNPETIQKIFGVQEIVPLEQKMPYLSRTYDACIGMKYNLAKLIMNNYELIKESMGVVRENVQKRIDLFNKSGLYFDIAKHN